jgi:hypothetical protein
VHLYYIQTKFMDAALDHLNTNIGTQTRSFEILALPGHFLVTGVEYN